MIEFSEDIGFWSVFVFWCAFTNTFACLGFTVVVIIGGIFDLRYLFRSLREEEIDDADDGRAFAPSSSGDNENDVGE